MADNLDPKNFAKAFADAVKLREESQRTLDIIIKRYFLIKDYPLKLITLDLHSSKHLLSIIF
jgi:hypothetical protein